MIQRCGVVGAFRVIMLDRRMFVIMGCIHALDKPESAVRPHEFA